MVKLTYNQVIKKNLIISNFYKYWNVKLSFIYLFIFQNLNSFNPNIFLINLKKCLNLISNLIKKNQNVVLCSHGKISLLLCKSMNINITGGFINNWLSGFLTNYKEYYKQSKIYGFSFNFPCFFILLNNVIYKYEDIVNECGYIGIPIVSLLTSKYNLNNVTYPLITTFNTIEFLYFYLKLIKLSILVGFLFQKLLFKKDLKKIIFKIKNEKIEQYEKNNLKRKYNRKNVKIQSSKYWRKKIKIKLIKDYLKKISKKKWKL